MLRQQSFMGLQVQQGPWTVAKSSDWNAARPSPFPATHPLVSSLRGATCALSSIAREAYAQRRARAAEESRSQSRSKGKASSRGAGGPEGKAQQEAEEGGPMSLDMVALVTVLALRRLYLLKFLGSGGFGAAFASMMLPEYGPPQELLPMAVGELPQAEQVKRLCTDQVLATKVQSICGQGVNATCELLFDQGAAALGTAGVNKSLVSDMFQMPAPILGSLEKLPGPQLPGEAASGHITAATYPLASQGSAANFLHENYKSDAPMDLPSFVQFLGSMLAWVLHGLGQIHAAKAMHRDLKLENILLFWAALPNTKHRDIFRLIALLADSGLMRKGQWTNVRTPETGTPGNLGWRSLLGCDIGPSDQDQFSLVTAALAATGIAGMRLLGSSFCYSLALAEKLAGNARKAGMAADTQTFLRGCSSAHSTMRKLAAAGHTPAWLPDFCHMHEGHLGPGETLQLRVAIFQVALRTIAMGKTPSTDVEAAVGRTQTRTDLRAMRALRRMRARKETQAEAAGPGAAAEASAADERELHTALVVQAAFGGFNANTLKALDCVCKAPPPAPALGAKRSVAAGSQAPEPLLGLGPKVVEHVLQDLGAKVAGDVQLQGAWQALQQCLQGQGRDASPAHMQGLCEAMLLEEWSGGVEDHTYAARAVAAALTRMSWDSQAPIPDWLPGVVYFAQCQELLDSDEAECTGKVVASWLPKLLTPVPSLLPQFSAMAAEMVEALGVDGAEDAPMLRDMLGHTTDPQAVAGTVVGPNAREVLREHDPHAIWLILRDQLAKDAQGGVFQRIAQQMVRPQWEGGLGLLQEDGQGGLGPAPQSEDALQLRHWFMQSLSAQGNEGLVMFRELNITRAVLDVLQSAEQSAWPLLNETDTHNLVVDELMKSKGAELYVDGFPDDAPDECTCFQAGQSLLMGCMVVLHPASYCPLQPGCRVTEAQRELCLQKLQRLQLELMQTVPLLHAAFSEWEGKMRREEAAAAAAAAAAVAGEAGAAAAGEGPLQHPHPEGEQGQGKAGARPPQHLHMGHTLPQQGQEQEDGEAASLSALSSMLQKLALHMPGLAPASSNGSTSQSSGQAGGSASAEPAGEQVGPGASSLAAPVGAASAAEGTSSAATAAAAAAGPQEQGVEVIPAGMVSDLLSQFWGKPLGAVAVLKKAVPEQPPFGAAPALGLQPAAAAEAASVQVPGRVAARRQVYEKMIREMNAQQRQEGRGAGAQGRAQVAAPTAGVAASAAAPAALVAPVTAAPAAASAAASAAQASAGAGPAAAVAPTGRASERRKQLLADARDTANDLLDRMSGTLQLRLQQRASAPGAAAAGLGSAGGFVSALSSPAYSTVGLVFKGAASGTAPSTSHSRSNGAVVWGGVAGASDGGGGGGASAAASGRGTGSASARHSRGDLREFHLQVHLQRKDGKAAEEEDGVGVAAASLDMLRLSVKDADQVREDIAVAVVAKAKARAGEEEAAGAQPMEVDREFMLKRARR